MSQLNDKNKSGLISFTFKWMGSIAGSLAGISAVLSVFGFLVLRSNSNLLGISSFLHHSIGDYMYIGGIFFITSFFVILPAKFLLQFYNIYSLIAVLIVIIIYYLIKNVAILKKALNKLDHFIFLIRWVLMIIAFFLFFYFIDQMIPSSNNVDLLFQDSSNPNVVDRATESGIKILMNTYADALMNVVISLFVLWIITKLGFSTKQKSTGERIFYYVICILFAIELILLPVNYGNTIYPNDYHLANIVHNDTKLEYSANNLWLINETDNEFVLYSGKNKNLILLNKGNDTDLILMKRTNIFNTNK